MKALIRLFLLLAMIMNFLSAPAQLAKFSLGDFKLENGEVIKDCIVTYRALGKMNQKKDNVIVLLTWFNGNSSDLIYLAKPGGWADSSKYYVVIIDALGDGYSSSPSNSIQQSKSAFPNFSIRDMIQTQHELLTKRLNLNHVFAIGGISMGASQTFQWTVSYPDFMDRGIMIEGTPQPNAYDKIFYRTDLKTIEIGLGNKDLEEKCYRVGIDLLALNGWTPDYIQRTHKANEVEKFLGDTETGFLHVNVYNWVYQLRALEKHDIFIGKSMEEISKTLKAKYFIEVNRNDHIINPHPAKAFAQFVKAKYLELTDDCGHLSFMCQEKQINQAVIDFLKE